MVPGQGSGCFCGGGVCGGWVPRLGQEGWAKEGGLRPLPLLLKRRGRWGCFGGVCDGGGDLKWLQKGWAKEGGLRPLPLLLERRGRWG